MRTTLAIFVVCGIFQVGAIARDGYCPPSIRVNQSIKTIPSQWTAATDDFYNSLMGVTLYDGPPSQHASLAYDNWFKRDGLAYASWTFTASSSTKRTATRIWLKYSYAYTTVTLAKELPEGTKSCDVTYDPKVEINGSPEVKDISCK
jgi:hypothetical protein